MSSSTNNSHGFTEKYPSLILFNAFKKKEEAGGPLGATAEKLAVVAVNLC